MNPREPDFLKEIKDVFYASHHPNFPKRNFDWKKVQIELSKWDGNESFEESHFKINLTIPSRDIQFTFGRNGSFDRIKTNNRDIEYPLNSTMDYPLLSHLTDFERAALALKRGSCLLMDAQALKPLVKTLKRMGLDQETEVFGENFGTYFKGELGEGKLVDIQTSFIRPVVTVDGNGYSYSLSNLTSSVEGESSGILYKNPEELIEALKELKKYNEDLAKKDSRAFNKNLDFLGEMVDDMRDSTESNDKVNQRIIGNVFIAVSSGFLYRSHEAANEPTAPCSKEFECVELNFETVGNLGNKGVISLHIDADIPKDIQVRLLGSINNQEGGIPLEWLLKAQSKINSPQGEAFIKNVRDHLMSTSPDMKEFDRSTSFKGCSVMKRSRQIGLAHFC
jgi:hypothetical protein